MTDKYFSGTLLYGNDFTLEEIEKWYKEEEEAYADLGSKNTKDYVYQYHHLNQIHCFSKIDFSKINNALGLGSAYGEEFGPISSHLKKITIIEPSEQLRSKKIGQITPDYVKPSIDGTINFPDNSFDLITSFGVLHHIPNVSYLLSELFRVLDKNGYLIIREPIISMGDWRNTRPGLTKNERGIPVQIFEEFIKSQKDIKIVSKSYLFTMTSFINRFLQPLLKKPLYSYAGYIQFDRLISKIFKFNVHYHATKKHQRIAPNTIIYILSKK